MGNQRQNGGNRLDSSISDTAIEKESCPGKQPGGVCYGCGVPGCTQDIDLSELDLEPDQGRREPVAPAATAVPEPAPLTVEAVDATVAGFARYVEDRLQQVIGEADPLKAKSIRELRRWTIAKGRALVAPVLVRIADAKDLMMHGTHGFEVVGEIDLREVLAEVALIQATLDRIVASAVNLAGCRAVLRARIIGRASTAGAATGRHYANVALLITAIAASHAFALAGRRACARGDDPDAASANIGRCSGQFVMERPPTLRGVGGFLCFGRVPIPASFLEVSP